MVYIDYSSSLIIKVSKEKRKKVCCYYAEQENSHYFIYAEGKIIPCNNFCPAFLRFLRVIGRERMNVLDERSVFLRDHYRSLIGP